MPDKNFWDSNLWIYLNAISEDARDVEKKNILEALLLESSHIVVSAQVLNEVANVLLKKFQKSEIEVKTRIEQIMIQSTVINLGSKLTLKALDLRGRYQFSWFDSLIVATALEGDCASLYSEDLQANLLIEGRLRVVNPFETVIKG